MYICIHFGPNSHIIIIIFTVSNEAQQHSTADTDSVQGDCAHPVLPFTMKIGIKEKSKPVATVEASAVDTTPKNLTQRVVPPTTDNNNLRQPSKEHSRLDEGKDSNHTTPAAAQTISTETPRMKQAKITSYTATTPTKQSPDDPYDIARRFVEPHLRFFDHALTEIAVKGQKEGCWIWFLFPTPPYMVNGVEVGSPRNRRYALRSDQEVVAYLQYKTVVQVPLDRVGGLYEENDDKQDDNVNRLLDLRQNYLDLLGAVEAQLNKGKVYLVNMFPYGDDRKVVSSIDLFARIGAQTQDDELFAACQRVLSLVEKQHKPPQRRFFSARNGRTLSL